MMMCIPTINQNAFRGRFRVIHTQREATSALSFQKWLCDDRFGCSRQHKKKIKSRVDRDMHGRELSVVIMPAVASCPCTCKVSLWRRLQLYTSADTVAADSDTQC